MLNSDEKDIVIRLIINTFLFILIISFLLFILDNFLRRHSSIAFYTSTPEEINLERFKKNIDKIDTLIIGDSHPGEDLADAFLPSNMLKITHPGENISLSLIKIKYYLSKSKRIKYLILPLDYHTLSGGWTTSVNDYHIYEQNVLSSIKSKNKLFDDFNRKILVSKILSKFNTKFELTNSNVKSNRKVNNAKDKLDYSKRVKERIDGMIFKPIINSESEQAFTNIYEITKERNIEIIGVRYPLPNEYINQVNKTGKDKITDWIRNNRSKFYLLYDYRDLYKNNQELFINEDHLSIKGSYIFTLELLRQLIQDTHSNNKIVDNLVKKHPETIELISLHNDLGIMSLNSAYQIETDGFSTWIWLGLGKEEGVKLYIYSKKPVIASVKVDFALNCNTTLNLDLNNRIIYEITDDLDSYVLSFTEGVNELTLYSSMIANRCAKNSNDPRNLIIKINKLHIN